MTGASDKTDKALADLKTSLETGRHALRAFQALRQLEAELERLRAEVVIPQSEVSTANTTTTGRPGTAMRYTTLREAIDGHRATGQRNKGTPVGTAHNQRAAGLEMTMTPAAVHPHTVALANLIDPFGGWTSEDGDICIGCAIPRWNETATERTAHAGDCAWVHACRLTGQEHRIEKSRG